MDRRGLCGGPSVGWLADKFGIDWMVSIDKPNGLMKSACECYEIVRFDRPERG